MTIDSRMSDAWREAGSRLSVRVVAPFQIDLPGGGHVDVEAFLPDFGGPGGIVAVSLEDEARGKLAAAGTYPVSHLGADYRRFDEPLFRETLDDWGWTGPDSERPSWYTGRPWR